MIRKRLIPRRKGSSKSNISNEIYCSRRTRVIFSKIRMIYSTGLARRCEPKSPARSADLTCQGVPPYEHKSLERRDALRTPGQEGFLPHSGVRRIAWVPRRDEGAPCSGEEPF